MTGTAVMAAYLLLVCLGTGMATGTLPGRGWFPGGEDKDPQPEPEEKQ